MRQISYLMLFRIWENLIKKKTQREVHHRINIVTASREEHHLWDVIIQRMRLLEHQWGHPYWRLSVFPKDFGCRSALRMPFHTEQHMSILGAPSWYTNNMVRAHEPLRPDTRHTHEIVSKINLILSSRKHTSQ